MKRRSNLFQARQRRVKRAENPPEPLRHKDGGPAGGRDYDITMCAQKHGISRRQVKRRGLLR